MSNNKYFDFDLPEIMLKMIEEYKKDTNPLHEDLYQCEIKSLARDLSEDQEEEVIDYFYRKRNRP